MHSKTVLIIESNKNFENLFVTTFNKIGCRLHFAQSQDTGLAVVQEINPSLIIIDASVVAGEGTELVGRFRRSCPPKATTIIASLPQGNRIIWDQAQEWGTDGFITKPFDPRGLIRRIEKLLAGL